MLFSNLHFVAPVNCVHTFSKRRIRGWRRSFGGRACSGDIPRTSRPSTFRKASPISSRPERRAGLPGIRLLIIRLRSSSRARPMPMPTSSTLPLCTRNAVLAVSDDPRHQRVIYLISVRFRGAVIGRTKRNLSNIRQFCITRLIWYSLLLELLLRMQLWLRLLVQRNQRCRQRFFGLRTRNSNIKHFSIHTPQTKID